MIVGQLRLCSFRPLEGKGPFESSASGTPADFGREGRDHVRLDRLIWPWTAEVHEFFFWEASNHACSARQTHLRAGTLENVLQTEPPQTDNIQPRAISSIGIASSAVSTESAPSIQSINPVRASSGVSELRHMKCRDIVACALR
jgi:hypothetical protein